MIFKIISIFLMALGCVVMFSAALALIRFDHVFMRIHASAKASTGGVLSILIGLLFRTGLIENTGKVILVIILIILTGPILSHALARAAHVGSGIGAEVAFEDVSDIEHKEDDR